ncbi:universal stress protein [Streptomyces pseudovenezuelae]|uniref:Universal stress protein n=1 Tax=Streptomyces pseudovenezuelae TaxID=67350 RepID=A0ABZ1WPQ1_9ACTN|nr:universal stress protein [Streptomyces pseudovenezuelae]
MSHPVLAGVDGSAHSAVAADWAAREATLRGVRLHLVHASPPLPGTAVPLPAVARLRHLGEQMLQRAVTDLSVRHPDLEVRSEQTDEAPAAALLTAARAAGLLVVGTRGMGGFDGLAVGSVALRVARGPRARSYWCPDDVTAPSETGRARPAAPPRWW